MEDFVSKFKNRRMDYFLSAIGDDPTIICHINAGVRIGLMSLLEECERRGERLVPSYESSRKDQVVAIDLLKALVAELLG